MFGDPSQFGGNGLRWKDKVYAARGHGAAGHRVMLCRVVLREGDASLGLDRFQPQCPVAGRTGEDDADGSLPSVLCQ